MNELQNETNVEWFGELWTLLPERAVYWSSQKTVILTDPHFGKDATFRSSGIAVPSGTTRRDLTRLGNVLDRYNPTRLLILGDFFHAGSSKTNETLDFLRCWRQHYAGIEVVNIQGNHDKHAGDPPADLSISVEMESWGIKSIRFAHHPDTNLGTPLVCGHLHPAIWIGRLRGSSGKLPCFWLTQQTMVLPAFGTFTGGARPPISSGDRVFGICDNEVLEIPVLQHQGK